MLYVRLRKAPSRLETLGLRLMEASPPFERVCHIISRWGGGKVKKGRYGGKDQINGGPGDWIAV